MNRLASTGCGHSDEVLLSLGVRGPGVDEGVEDFDSTKLKDLENLFVSNALPFLFLLLSSTSDDISTTEATLILTQR